MDLWYALGFSIIFNLGMFLIAFRQGTDKLTDISYAATFIALAVFGLTRTSETLTSQWILFYMVVFWAVRIGGYLFMRIRKTGKDKRFDKMRGNFRKFLSFWLLQAFTVWVVMLGVLEFFAEGVEPVGAFMVVGLLLWLIGLIIEAVADMQKFQFMQNTKNKDKWIQSGLWKYSRHPNYFGEILVWFGVYVFVVSGLQGTAQLLSMASPLFIMFMLLFVSGIPLLEKSADARWGKDKNYIKYKNTTSIIIPFPHKS
jgi:steroid 5-alpha reductase family enzyme